MRTFSFSGFNPDGQMAAFTGAAEYHPAAVGDYGPYYGSPAHDAYGPSSSPVQDSYGPPASGAVNPHDKHRYAASDLHHQVPADSKEQYNNSVEQTGDKKRHRGKCGSFPLDRGQNEFSSFQHIRTYMFLGWIQFFFSGRFLVTNFASDHCCHHTYDPPPAGVVARIVVEAQPRVHPPTST